jgi:hypothetical protein
MKEVTKVNSRLNDFNDSNKFKISDCYICAKLNYTPSGYVLVGTEWAFQYDEEGFAGQAEKFGLTELKIPENN